MDVLTNSTNESFKYNHEILTSCLDEYKLVKNFFEKNYRSGTSLSDFKVYRIFENNPESTVANKLRNNLMLMHGTKEKNVEGILKIGFINSKEGKFGQGVYMTDCSNVSLHRCLDGEDKGDYKYIFVNEVLESEKMQTLDSNYFVIKKVDTKPEHQFQKHEMFGSKQLSENDYKVDAQGRRYRNVPHNRYSSKNEYLADESITIPRYLIKLK